MQALVIDDSRAMRAILGRILRDLGFEVREAEHGLAGLERLRETVKTDLVLVDWNMPVMDGLRFLKAVREAGDLGEFRTIVVTTETESGRIAEALAEGADQYVMKPFTQEIILQKLEKLGLGVKTRWLFRDSERFSDSSQRWSIDDEQWPGKPDQSAISHR